MSMSVTGAAMAGVQRGMQSFERSAATVANPDNFADKTSNLTSAMVEMQQAQVQIQTATKAVSTENKALGSLIDISV